MFAHDVIVVATVTIAVAICGNISSRVCDVSSCQFNGSNHGSSDGIITLVAIIVAVTGAKLVLVIVIALLVLILMVIIMAPCILTTLLNS